MLRAGPGVLTPGGISTVTVSCSTTALPPEGRSTVPFVLVTHPRPPIKTRALHISKQLCDCSISSLWFSTIFVSHKTFYSNKIFSASLRYNLASVGVDGVRVPSSEPMLLVSGPMTSLYNNCNSGSASLFPQTVRVLCTYEFMRQVRCCLISQRRKLSLTEGGKELEQRLRCVSWSWDRNLGQVSSTAHVLIHCLVLPRFFR